VERLVFRFSSYRLALAVDSPNEWELIRVNETTLELVMPAGHTLFARRVGEGSPVLLLHGFPLDSRIWQNQWSTLAQQGYDVVVPDLPGFGHSTSMLGTDISLDDWAEDLETLRRFCFGDQSIAMVGLSMGGYVALAYWKRWAQHLHQLVLTNTKPSVDAPAAQQARWNMAEQVQNSTTWEAVAPMLPRLVCAHTREQSESTVHWLQSMMAAVAPGTIATAQRAMARREDFTERLAKIGVPTLVVTGDQDPLSTPPENQQWSQRLTRGQFHIIPQAGHLPMLENPDSFNQVLVHFLNQHPSH